MELREYKPTDCEQMSQLFYNTVHSVNVKDYTEEQLNAWATGSVDLQEWSHSFLKHKTVVAVEDDEIVGFGDIDQSGYLDRLYVHMNYQGMGIASAICNELECAVIGDLITTHASITAKPFFEHRGYKVVLEQEVDMIKIVWSINDINKYQTGSLPDDAVKIETPQSVGELMKKAVPIAAILCVFLFIAMLCKTIICKTVVISPIFILVGFAFGFLLLIIHEWLHGIVYPKEADVTIGRIKGKTTFVALASYPLKRNRFILMCLLPFVLGLVPFILFVISPAEFRVFNGLNFGMACMGMVSPFPDVFNVLAVLRNSEKSDSIMFYKNDMYKIS